MSSSLAQRYTHGNFVDLPAFSAEEDFFVGGPARERELVHLARTQVDVQRKAADAIVASNLASSVAICNELRAQSSQLESAIQQGSAEIVAQMDELGDRVCGELLAIRWELAQLVDISHQTLAVLRKPRSTEAQELLQQGVRNLVNDKIPEAEERFLLALKLDNTDYQVLMNLSDVAIRKGDADRAQAYLRDALTLPPKLDADARADALWSATRVRYALEDYTGAAKFGRQSLEMRDTPRRHLQLGAYLLLARNETEGLAAIAQAVRSDPKLFPLAAAHPDLAQFQSQVWKLLDDLYQELARQSEEKLSTLGVTLERTSPRAPETNEYKRQTLLAAARLGAACRRNPSYADAVALYWNIEALMGVAERLMPFDGAKLAQRSAEETATTALATLTTAEARGGKRTHLREPGCLATLSAVLVGAIVFFVGSLIHADFNQEAGCFIVAILPLTWIGMNIFLKQLGKRFDTEEREAREWHKAASEALRHAQFGADLADKDLTERLQKIPLPSA